MPHATTGRGTAASMAGDCRGARDDRGRHHFGPTQISSGAGTVTTGTVTVPVNNQDANGACQLVLTTR